VIVPLSAIVEITIACTALMSLERRATPYAFPELSVIFYPGLAILAWLPRLALFDWTEPRFRLFEQPLYAKIVFRA